MNPVELELQALHAPPPPSTWLLTPFEWALLAGTLLLLGYLFRYGRRALRKQRELQRWYRLRAELVGLFAHDPCRAAATSSRVIRRLAARLDPDPKLRGLTGEVWLSRLDTLTESRFFTQDRGRRLLDAPFTRTIEEHQIAALLASFDTLLEHYARRLEDTLKRKRSAR